MSLIDPKNLIRTSSVPSQWQANSSDGRMILITYYQDILEIRISENKSYSIRDAIEGKILLQKENVLGDISNNYLTTSELNNMLVSFHLSTDPEFIEIDDHGPLFTLDQDFENATTILIEKKNE